MTTEENKAVLQGQLTKLEADKQELSHGIQETQNKIQELQKTIERNIGAISYIIILSDKIGKQLETLNKEPIQSS